MVDGSRHSYKPGGTQERLWIAPGTVIQLEGHKGCAEGVDAGDNEKEADDSTGFPQKFLEKIP